MDAQAPELRTTLQGIARDHGTWPRHPVPLAPPLTAAVIKRAGACGSDLRGEQDRALVLLGFAGAFQRSEPVASQVAGLAFGPHGLSVFLPRSKADLLAAHCSVVAVQSWLGTAGIERGWLSRCVIRNDTTGRHGLAPESVRLVLRQPARHAGYRGDALARITPHSLRAGCITTLAQASVHERDIMAHSPTGRRR